MEINNKKKRWIGEFGCWLSQGLNLFVCIVGSSADETVSSRIGKYKKNSGNKVPFYFEWPVPFFYIVYHFSSRLPWLKGHFMKAIEIDEGNEVE